MKKNILSAIGAAGVAAILVLSMTVSTEKSKASTMYGANLTALAPGGGSGGKCTGPRPQGGNCESSNTNKCSDMSGCNSIAVNPTDPGTLSPIGTISR